MLFFFNVVYDVVWFVVVYLFFYSLVDYMFREYSQVVKILFDINVRLFNYNKEMNVRERHSVLYTCSSAISFIVLTINPVAHCTLYVIFMQMYDTVDLNRILLYILLFRLVKGINPSFTDLSFDPLLVMRILYLVLNYHNTSVAVPILFQIIDEVTDVNYFFMDLLKIHDKLFGDDTVVKSKLLHVTVFLQKNMKMIINIKLVALTLLTLISFARAPVSFTWMEIGFYYYAVARVMQVYRC